MKKTLKTILGTVAILFLLSTCTYSPGYPRNCDEAIYALNDIDKEYDSALNELWEVPSDKQRQLKVTVLSNKQKSAEANVSRLCTHWNSVEAILGMSRVAGLGWGVLCLDARNSGIFFG